MEGATKLVLVQAAVVAVVAIAYWMTRGTDAGLGAAYGGSVSLVNALLLVFSVRKANRVAERDAKQSVYVLYFGAVVRFVVALVGLGFGLGYLELAAVPVIVAFGIAYLAQMLQSGYRQQLA